MDRERLQRIEELYHEASTRPPEIRREWLERVCANDPELRVQVEKLLSRATDSDNLLAKPLAEAAANLFLGTKETHRLSPGTRLGPYEIIAVAGTGGMGEVYRARDVRLDRTVAIKVLAPDLIADRNSRERFNQEARAISRLNHPHICALHDIGEQHGIDFLVMEYVEGETLQQRLGRAPLPLQQTLQYATEIADALDKAHRQGVVHRDLKPSNVMITKSGAKLLDFGIAKLQGIDTSEEGPLVGTVHYMAPELFQNHEADARSDIFAFGIVLYEMLTGTKPFKGSRRADVVAAILERDPPAVSSLNANMPTSLDRLVEVCLHKDPADRWQSAHDVMKQLRWIDTLPPPVSRDLAPQRRSKLGGFSNVAVVLLAVAAGIWVGQRAFRNQAVFVPPQPVRFSIGITPAERMNAPNTLAARPGRNLIALSPDGQVIVFAAWKGRTRQLYRRRLEDTAAEPLAGTEGASIVFFSPDSRWIGFIGGGRIQRIAPSGGPSFPISEVPPPLWGASWAPNNMIFFSGGEQGIWQVPAFGGNPVQLTSPDREKGELSHVLPNPLPNNTAVLYTIRRSVGWDDSEIVSRSLTDGSVRTLIRGGSDGRYVEGHLLFMRSGSLMAARFDLENLEVTGDPVIVMENVMHSIRMPDTILESGAGLFSVSSSGTLVFLAGGANPPRDYSVVAVDRKGKELKRLPIDGTMLRLSPEGSHIAYAQRNSTSGNDIWLYDIRRELNSPLTSTGNNGGPIWSPDGKSIVFHSDQENTGDFQLLSVPSDGRGVPDRLYPTTYSQIGTSWSKAGLSYLSYVRSQEGTGTHEVLVLPMTGERIPVTFLRSQQGPLTHAVLSPAGNWMLYRSPPGLYLQKYPEGGQRHAIVIDTDTPTAALAAAWTKDGHELIYSKRLPSGLSQFFAMEIRTEPALRIGSPQLLFEGDYPWTDPIRNWDVYPDGEQFVLVKRADAPQPVSEIHVVLNWLGIVNRTFAVH